MPRSDSWKICKKNGTYELKDSIITSRNNSGANSYNIDYDHINPDNYIILILESPHIEEYDSNTLNPYGPACGKGKGTTGRDIEDFIGQVITNSPNL